MLRRVGSSIATASGKGLSLSDEAALRAAGLRESHGHEEQSHARPRSVKTSVASNNWHPCVVLALAFCLHAGFSGAQTPRFDWRDITAIAWADASIVPLDIR